MNSTQPRTPHRRGLRYSLRGLMLLVTAFAALLGYEEYCTRREARAVTALERMQGSVTFQQIGPAWLRRLAGDRYLQRVHRADVYAETVDEVGPVLETFRRLEEVRVLVPKWPNPFRDDDVGPDLASLEDVHSDVTFVRCLIFRNPISGHSTRLTMTPPGSSEVRVVAEEVIARNNDLEQWIRRSDAWKDVFPSERIVRISRGRHLRILFCNADVRPGANVQESAAVLLMDGNVVIDGRNWDVARTDDVIRLITEDLNSDGRLDVGVHYRGVLTFPPTEFRVLPGDARVWLDAFKITETGFESLFGEETKGDHRTTTSN